MRTNRMQKLEAGHYVQDYMGKTLRVVKRQYEGNWSGYINGQIKGCYPSKKRTLQRLIEMINKQLL